MNVKLLRKVQKFLLDEPRRFDMCNWITNQAENMDVLKDPPCGTACCIAGAVYVIANKLQLDPEKEYPSSAEVNYFAISALGLGKVEADRLFLTPWWPEELYKKYDSARTPLQRAKVGVARIEHFIKTNGAE